MCFFVRVVAVVLSAEIRHFVKILNNVLITLSLKNHEDTHSNLIGLRGSNKLKRYPD
jgi:hypothetical protein